MEMTTNEKIKSIKTRLIEEIVDDVIRNTVFNKIEDVIQRIDLALYELLTFVVYIENAKIEYDNTISGLISYRGKDINKEHDNYIDLEFSIKPRIIK